MGYFPGFTREQVRKMHRLCTIVGLVFAAAYLFALVMLAIGTFGLFGQERDPLSAVFLIPLGLPWNLGLTAFPDALRPWLAIAAPAANLFVIQVACRYFPSLRR